MSTWQIILGVLLFAVATAVVYVWGLQKSIRQPDDLRRILMGKCAAKIRSYLKRNDTITDREIVQQISGVRAGQFWSKRQVAVQDPKKFAGELTEYLLSQQLIEPAGKSGYRLKK